MPTNQQRRAAERRRLQKQLDERRAREQARKRFTLIASIVGTLVVIAGVVVVIVLATGGNGSKKPAASKPSNGVSSGTSTAPASTASTASTAPSAPLPTKPCAAAPNTATSTFDGLTFTGTKDVTHAAKITGKQSGPSPTTLQCEDLVIGTGKVASTSSQATVEYIGLVYKTGKIFQSSWTAQPATFGLSSGPGGVIAGFSQGIAGAGKVAPMRVGGRRVILMPAEIAYGASPPAGSGIPANADLVFVVDLQKIAS